MGAGKHQGAEEPLGELLPARQPQLQLAAAARAAARAGLRGDSRVVPPQGVESLRALLAAGGSLLPGLRHPPTLASTARAHAANLAQPGDGDADTVAGSASVGSGPTFRPHAGSPHRDQRSAGTSTGGLAPSPLSRAAEDQWNAVPPNCSAERPVPETGGPRRTCMSRWGRVPLTKSTRQQHSAWDMRY